MLSPALGLKEPSLVNKWVIPVDISPSMITQIIDSDFREKRI